MDLKNSIRKYREVWILLGVFAAMGIAVLAFCLSNVHQMPDVVGRTLTAQEQEEVTSRNSPLTQYVYLTPNAGFPREEKIDTITIHHMAGDLTLERLGEEFALTDRRVSANYGVDISGKVGLYVEECNRAWTSANVDNDNRAVTIEVANDENGGDWHISEASYEALIQLCVDICRRNGIEALRYTGDTSGNLTTHNMFADTDCPGPYLESRMQDIADAVNRQLSSSK